MFNQFESSCIVQSLLWFVVLPRFAAASLKALSRHLLPFQLALKRPSMELGVTQVVEVLAYFWFFSYLSLMSILALDESGDADCNIL